MAQYIVSHSTNILGNNIATTLNESISASSLSQIDAGTRRTTKRNHVLEILQAITLGITGGEHDISNILLDLLVDINLANHAASLQNLLGCSYRGNGRHLACDILADNLLLLFECRIIDNHLEHETVDLCLRQWVGTLLLDRVLSSHYQEWVRQLKGLTTDSNLLFLHGLEQCTLHLCWGTVNFIGQHEVGKYGALLYLELLVLLRVDHSTYHVSREQVGGKLNTAVI